MMLGGCSMVKTFQKYVFGFSPHILFLLTVRFLVCRINSKYFLRCLQIRHSILLGQGGEMIGKDKQKGSIFIINIFDSKHCVRLTRDYVLRRPT